MGSLITNPHQLPKITSYLQSSVRKNIEIKKEFTYIGLFQKKAPVSVPDIFFVV